MVSLEAKVFNSGLSWEKGSLVKMEMRPSEMWVTSEGREGSSRLLVQMGLGKFDEGVWFLVKMSEKNAFVLMGFIDFQWF